MSSHQITAADMASVEEQIWQQNRAMGIGGSEVGALLGVDPYSTPYYIWERKTGRADGFEGNDYTRAGHLLEPVIKQWFTEQTGLKIHPVEHYASPTHPWRRVTPDGIVGDHGLMDAKNSRFEISPDEIREGKKMNWYFQIMWGIGIWNELHPQQPLTNGYIVWLGAGYQFQYLKFDYEQDVYEMMCEVVDHFWNEHVLTDIPPPPITREDILKAVGKVIPKAKELEGDYAEFYQQYVHAKSEIKKWEEVADEMQQAIQLHLLEHDTATLNGKPVLTWKEQAATRLDSKRLKEEMPDIWQKYSATSKTRVFRLK